MTARAQLREFTRWLRWVLGLRITLTIGELHTFTVGDQQVNISIASRLANMVALGDELELDTPLTERPIVMKVDTIFRPGNAAAGNVTYISGEELR